MQCCDANVPDLGSSKFNNFNYWKIQLLQRLSSYGQHHHVWFWGLHWPDNSELMQQNRQRKMMANFVWKNLPPNFTFLWTHLFVEEPKIFMLSEFLTKHASNSPFTFVTLKRFAVLFFVPSCCVNSLIFCFSFQKTSQQ